MSQRSRLARDSLVEKVHHQLAIEALLVGEDDDILVVMRRAAAQPETRLVGIVDASGVLVGVLPILRLAESVVARVAPEALLTDIAGIEDVKRFEVAVRARVVRDVMLAPAAVAGTATVDAAFHMMRARHLSALYVVDDAGRPTGYLDLLELAVSYVDALEDASADDPS